MEHDYDPNVSRLYVYKDAVVLILDGLDYKFPFDVWEAMFRYVRDCRNGISDGARTEIKHLPERPQWDGSLPE